MIQRKESVPDLFVQKSGINNSRFDSIKFKNQDIEINHDLKIGKRAYYDLCIKHGGGGVVIDQSVGLSSTMMILEQVLDRLQREPGSDLFDINKKNDGDFVPLKLSELEFKKYFIQVLPWLVRGIRELPVECEFSPAVNVFIKCCRDYDVGECIQSFGDRQLRNSSMFQMEMERINDFYWKLKECLCSRSVRKQICNHKRQIESNCTEFQSYVDDLFKLHARLVVVRLDLEYGSESKPSLDQARSDLDHFLSNRNHNSLFNAMSGYIVKLEFGMKNGYHIHTLLFFDGSKRANYADSDLAKKIGEYWKKVITKGRGRYWNLNDKKSNFSKNGRLGIGTIHASEFGKIENLKNIVRYFCKKDQFFKPANKLKFKTIRKGNSLNFSGKKLGRPRIINAAI